MIKSQPRPVTSGDSTLLYQYLIIMMASAEESDGLRQTLSPRENDSSAEESDGLSQTLSPSENDPSAEESDGLSQTLSPGENDQFLDDLDISGSVQSLTMCASRPVTPASPKVVKVKSPQPGVPMYGCG